jgi:signal transduction histidine kinase
MLLKTGSKRIHLPTSLALPLAVILVPLAALVALEAYQAFVRTPLLIHSQQSIEQSFELITTTQAVRSALQNAERGQRGYLLTADPRYLQSYRDGIEQAPQQLARLRQLSIGSPDQQRIMPILAQTIATKLREMRTTLDAYQRNGLATAQQFMATDIGFDTMSTIERLLDATVASERERLRGRLSAAANEEASTAYNALASALVTLLLMVVGIILIVQAFHGARKMEAERRATEQRLNAQLAQTQAALAQTQKMEALGQLTGGVAHDFNNLLHVIGNAVRLLQHRLATTDGEAGQYLDMIKRSSERAAGITSRLLAFSRRQPLEPQPTDVNKLVAGMSELLRHTLGESVALETVLGSAAWMVSVDRNQLETAILNLALNARDAMPEGGKLTIETSNIYLDEPYATLHSDVKVGQYTLVAVSDTGTGMTAEVAARAFDPFFTTKEPGRGTGLGLSQVFGFMKQSGGHVKIYSELAQGTTIKMYLPRLSGAASVHAIESVQKVAVGSGESILIVEDDRDVGEFTARMLSNLGYRVATAPNGPQALKLLEQSHGVELLFTDVGLPEGMSGRVLADEAQRRWPRIRVLYTTGYARNSIFHHGRLDPGVDLITKPFTLASLATKVRQVLDGRAPPTARSIAPPERS